MPKTDTEVAIATIITIGVHGNPTRGRHRADGAMSAGRRPEGKGTSLLPPSNSPSKTSQEPGKIRLITEDSLTVMVNRPPKPPCWRDFLPDGAPSGRKEQTPVRVATSSGKSKRNGSSLQFTDLSQLGGGQKGGAGGHGDGEGVGSAVGVGVGVGVEVGVGVGVGVGVAPVGVAASKASSSVHPRSKRQGNHLSHSATLPSSIHRSATTAESSAAKSHKKHRGRLHRTRSEFSIDRADLPEIQNMTVSLGEARPGREFGLRTGPTRLILDARSYFEENARRCQLWLQGVKASEPLEDVEFDRGPGVEVEVPEETYGGRGRPAAHRPAALRSAAQRSAPRLTPRRPSDPLSEIDSASVDRPASSQSPPPTARGSNGKHRPRTKQTKTVRCRRGSPVGGVKAPTSSHRATAAATAAAADHSDPSVRQGALETQRDGGRSSQNDVTVVGTEGDRLSSASISSVVLLATTKPATQAAGKAPLAATEGSDLSDSDTGSPSPDTTKGTAIQRSTEEHGGISTDKVRVMTTGEMVVKPSANSSGSREFGFVNPEEIAESAHGHEGDNTATVSAFRGDPEARGVEKVNTGETSPDLQHHNLPGYVVGCSQPETAPD